MALECVSMTGRSCPRFKQATIMMHEDRYKSAVTAHMPRMLRPAFTAIMLKWTCNASVYLKSHL